MEAKHADFSECLRTLGEGDKEGRKSGSGTLAHCGGRVLGLIKPQEKELSSSGHCEKHAREGCLGGQVLPHPKHTGKVSTAW